MKKETQVVISDTSSRTLKASAAPERSGFDVLVTRIWKNPFSVTTVGVSLAELEEILKRFNGGERSG